jgi:hypothetical protein
MPDQAELMPDQAELVTVTQKRYRCRHIHAAGNQCGSPALRNEHFCYHHHTTRRPKPANGKFRHIDAWEPFELALVEDRASALAAASHLLQRIASNDLDPERAGKLLYNLQIITKLLPGQPVPAAATVPHAATPAPAPALTEVEEVIDDKVYGLIAPQTELPPEPATEPVSALGSHAKRPEPHEVPVILSECSESKDPDTTHTASTARTVPPPDLPTADSRQLTADR